VIGRNTWIESGAEIVDSIVMDHCRIGHDARIHRGIVDRYNFVQDGEVVAADAEPRREGAQVEGDLIALRRGRTRPI
ncbi:MAG: glucose-1-phosphate adenylyltransferase, partial [Gemmatimonadetes bacterium]|nr:glucose-1-phosphate adenylyltransferase [Gemmatimonadota bacterium]